jgi:hypothetical protein
MIHLILRQRLFWIFVAAPLFVAGWSWFRMGHSDAAHVGAQVTPTGPTAGQPSVDRPPIARDAVTSSEVAAVTPALAVTAVSVEGATAPTPVAAFNDWMERYRAATSASAKAALLGEGEALARKRREALFQLIQSDPRAALEAAVPMALRQELPESVQALLEERVSGRGHFGVFIADDFEANWREVRREVTLGGRRYEAFVYGARSSQPTRDHAVLQGIAVGNRFAVHERAVRALEPGELVPPARGDERCPVSSRAPDSMGTPALAEVAGQIERFCGVGHIELLNQRLAGDIDGGGGGDEILFKAADSWSQGPKTALFMRVTFPDDPVEPITEDGAYALMDGVNQWFVENSYGTTSIIPTVTPLLILPQPKGWYSVQGTGALRNDARDAARQLGYDSDNYDWDLIRHPSVPGFNWGGLASVRGRGLWLQSSSLGVACHELGHNYGIWHANFWNASGDSVIGPGAHVEYGNSFDTMGAASAGNNQFNAAFKSQLDWLPDSFVQTVKESGTYRLYTFDVPNLVSGQKYALKVRKDYDRNYWAEFRQKFTGNRWFLNGIHLNWDPWNNGVVDSAGGTHLLDTTPGTADGKNDCPVIIGRTFSDWAAGVHFTPVAKGNTSPENWIDVVVNLGAFPTNTAPVAAITADRSSVAANVTVNFSANASDADGDELAYAWDFGDATFGANSPNATKSWSAAGEYTVRCTVSDMKGGIYSQKVLITVGAPATFRASGRVTTDAGAPIEGVRVHNGGSGAAYRGTYTDSDGYYVLPNLAAGQVTLSAVKYGYAVTRAGWANPIALGPGKDGLDWTAMADTVVSVAAIDPSASEAGLNPGQFRLSRVGQTNTTLVVKFNRTGSATFNADYTMSPTPAGTPLQITFPAGSPFVNINVTPVSDVTSEGPETVTLTLLEETAYVLGPLAEATLIIADDEAPARPTVDVSASSPSALADNLATENGNDTGVFTFTRSGGSVANELVVRYSVSGTATPGVDYAALAGVVSIPAGETVTTVPFKAIDDLEVETNETVIVTIQADATYNGAGDSTTITIVDDDPVTVTIFATDDTAREAGASSGAFTVTRQGSLAANLVVTYALSGTASNSTDYSTLSGSVTIPAGRATATITVTPVNDTVLEGEETVAATLLNSPVYNVGNPGHATIILVDDEGPSITLSASDATAAEGGANPGAFTFTRTGSTATPLTAYFAVNGTARNGLDYAAIGNSIEIPASAASAVLTITPLDDAVLEAPERATLTVLPNPNYTVGTTTPQSVTINDNDSGLPAVGFTLAGSSGLESDATAQISVSLSSNAATTVTVNYAVTGGSAAGGGVDYTLASGTLRFLPSTNTQNLNLSVVNDTLVETNETVLITLSSPSGAVLDITTTHTYTILDDDTSGAITVTATDAIGTESGPTTGTFRIARSGGTGSDQTVYFQIIGSANSPSDYLPLASSAVIPAGAAFVDISVVPVDDTTDETNETVVINLTSAPGGRIGSPDLATLIIVDDDSSALPIVTIEATDPNASEPGADTALFTLRRTGDPTDALPVNFTVGGTATSGTDFLSLGTLATIPAGVADTTFTLTPRDDAIFESNETVVVTLTMTAAYRIGIGAESATAILSDNEAGVSVAAAGSSMEDGSSVGAFTVMRTGSTAAALSVAFTIGGTAGAGDFAALVSPVVIPAGTNEVTLPVTPVDDAAPEGNETVVLTLAAGAGYTVTTPNSATVLILDDEPGVSIAASDASAYEAGGSGAFTVTRTGATNSALTVFYTVSGAAGSGVDYEALAGSVVIEAGLRSAEVPVVPIDDADTEGNETVQATLLGNAAYAVLAPSSALVTIIDDEINLLPVVTITSPAVETVYLVNTANLLVLEATASDDGRPNPPASLTTAWSKVSGPGTVTFADSNAVNTTASFAAYGTYVLRLTASDSQLSASDELAVVVAPEATLAAGLQAYWKFDQTNGTVALDSSPNARHAALTGGAVFAPGQFNNALELDGVDDTAAFPSMNLPLFTVTAWIRADTQGDSTTPRVLAMPGYNIRVRRDTSSTSNAVALESMRSTTDGEWRTPGNVVSDGVWAHIAVAYDSASTANTPVFYINGQLQTTTTRTAPAGTQDSNVGTGYIGNAPALNRSWDGRIDDMRIYNRLLSAAEVQQIAAGPPANLAPFVNAGLPQSIGLAEQATIRGFVGDDGRPAPPGAVTSFWSTVSGPGFVTIADDSSLETTATFSAGGVYVLRLTADDSEVKTADDVVITVIAPTVVSIVATDALAAEFRGQGTAGGQGGGGVFTVSRTGDLNSALPVQLAISGTASNGIDYYELTNVVVIPSGAASANLYVWPLSDGLPEGEETVQFSVMPEAGYLIGTPSADTVYLQDAPWDAWRWEHFSAEQLNNPAISGDLADPDLDSLVNLLEYAFNFDPLGPDEDPGFSGAVETVSSLAGEQMAYVVRFHRRLDPSDLIYEVQVSTDFNTWQSGPNYTRELLPRQPDPGGVTAMARVQILGPPMTQPGRRFVRLRVRLQEIDGRGP